MNKFQRSRLLLLFCCLTASAGCADEVPISPSISTIPGDFYTERPTLQCLGFRWYISGDANRNGQVHVSYQGAGEKMWKESLPLLRINGETSMRGDKAGEWTAPNMFAGSILNLTPNTSYIVKLSLSDPDGGQAEKTVTLKTRAEPQAFAKGRALHVYPPQYSAAKTEPAFNGLRAAYLQAQPGDVILLHAGEYKIPEDKKLDRTDYILDKSGTIDKPIVFRGAADGEAILEGDGALKLIDCRHADYHYFENITLRGADHLLYAGSGDQGCTGLVVRHCKFDDAGFPIFATSMCCRDFYIADSTFHGPAQQWTPRKLSDEKYGQTHAVWIAGQGHVVCYNRIDSYWDGIDLVGGRPPAERDQQNAAVDFHHNLLSRFADDGIEMDYGVHNIRVFDNFIYNTFMGISAQPVYGGPGYIFRNVVYNATRSPIKPNQWPAGLMLFNNTFVVHGSAGRWAAMWQNTQLYNNLFFGTDGGAGVIWTGTPTPETTRMDYNGWYFFKSGEANPIWWKFSQPTQLPNSSTPQEEGTFADLTTFAHYSGYEKNGMAVGYSAFVKVTPPSGEEQPLPELDFRLSAGSKAIDAGKVLPTITDGFVGKAPDLGAYETGQPIPHYGPRS